MHAKGTGAFGYFEVTKDITKYCKVSLIEQKISSEVAELSCNAGLNPEMNLICPPG